ncbi:MAG: hypothetical protein IJE48_02285 [Clostridia bacterium]|nr:hypothetical protein [Clostridia bacterium]
MKKIVSVILAIIMVFSVMTVGASAAAVKTECGGNCDTCPSIVVPGIGQSNVWALDENGDYLLDDNGERMSCFPAIFDIGYIIKRAIFPVLLTLLTQSDAGLSAALSDVILDSFAVNMCDDNGKNTGNIEVEKYPYSVAECSEYEKEQIYDNVPLINYANQAGEDHLYYFAYNSFANHLDIVNELYDFVQMVKKDTGHDKVNLVPISMGGSVMNGLLEYHPDVMDDINKVVYIVPALDGSTIVGDLLMKDLTFLDKDFLFNGFLETLMDEDEARMIEVIARIIPDDVLLKGLKAAVNTLVDEVAVNITTLWALSPSSYYPQLALMHLTDPSKAEIKRQTEMYYYAQVNSDKNIRTLIDKGAQVFNIVDYDVPLYCIGNTWNEDNADGVIHLDSTSMGVKSAKVGETLPEGYVQANTNCSNPAHNHISPDRVVDASTGLLPDTTFYFDAQNHEKTARNDIIISLATRLLATDDITDVYSSPDYPQFNGARDPRGLKNSHIPAAKAVDTSALSPEVAAELEAALAEAEAFVNGTVCYAGQQDEIEEKLIGALVKAGVYTAEEEEEPSDFFGKLSLWLYDNYGTEGYIEMPPITVNLIAKGFITLLNEYILEPINKML